MRADALYYPWIDPPNRLMLVTSVLYWDHLFTIVPKSVGRPFHNEWSHAAEQHGFLRPRFVDRDCPEVTAASEQFVADFGRKAIRDDVKNARKRGWRNGGVLHPDKVSTVLHKLLWQKARQDDEGFYPVTQEHGLPYMARLASVVYEQDKLVPYTDRRLSRDVIIDRYTDQTREDVVGKTEAALVKLSIGAIRLGPSTSFADLIRFRDDHHDGLVRYRKSIRALARSASGIADASFPERELIRIAKEELKPAEEVVGARLKEAGWDFAIGTLQATVAGGGTYAVSRNLLAALVGAGISIVFSAVRWRMAKSKVPKDALSYLASVRKELHHEDD